MYGKCLDITKNNTIWKYENEIFICPTKWKTKKYHTVGTVPNSNKYHIVGTVPDSNKYHTVGTVPNSNRKLIETETKIDTHITQIDDHSLT